MIITLFSGILSIAGLFVLLKKLTNIPTNIIGTMVAVITLVVFMPVAIIYWPGGDVFAIHLAIYMITVYGITVFISQREKNSQVHWAPVVIISFFVLLVLVDSFFVTIADKGLSRELADMVLPKSNSNIEASYNFPGKVVHDYYQKGNLYNNYLENIDARKRSNWKIKKGWLKEPTVNEDAIFQVQITDKDNIAISKAKVSGKFIRYSDSRLDMVFTMQHIKNGYYQATVKLPAVGRWGLALKIEHLAIVYELGGNTSVSFPKSLNQDTIAD